MTYEILNLLKEGNEVGIKDYIFDKELEFYGSKNIDNVTIISFSGPNYKKLMEILKINNKKLIYSEKFTDKSLVSTIKIYKTTIYNLYFLKKEQFEFGSEDKYVVISKLIFSSNIEKVIEMGKEELLKHYVVKDINENRLLHK